MDIALYEYALRDESLPRIPKHVLLYFIFRCGENKECYVSQAKLAKQLCYTRARVSNAINFLREAGIIESRTRGKILTYDLCPYSTCAKKAQDVCPQSTRTSAPRAHRTSFSTSNITIHPKVLEGLKEAWQGSGITFGDYLRKRGYA